jgi:hypothetical protein
MDALIVMLAFFVGVLMGEGERERARARQSLHIDIEAVHGAMLGAPHDGQPYRQARAAVAAVLGQLAAGKGAP